MRRRIAAAAVCLAAASTAPLLSQGGGDREPGWYNTTELSLVNTGGNSESETFSFNASTERVWESSDLKFSAGGLRAESTTTTRSAIGPNPSDFVVVETDLTRLTAEKYYLRGRYGHRIRERLQWFAAGGWESNEFAGIDSRTSLGGGVGHTWWQEDDSHFRTDYGLFWTREEDLAGLTDEFVVARLAWDYLRPLTQTTAFGSTLAFDDRLEEVSDFRVDTTNWVSVAINKRLALRVSLQLLYDNKPSTVTVPLLLMPDVPTGEFVMVELDELDRILTVGLVINF